MNKPQSTIERYTQWVVNKPWQAIALSLFVVVVIGAGIKNLKMSTDFRDYFGAHNPELAQYDYMEQTYNKRDNIFFMLSPKSGNILSQEMLEMQLEFTKDAWQLPFSRRVDSLTNFQHMRAEGDDLIIEDMVYEGDDEENLLANGDFSPAYIKDLRARVLSESRLVGNFVKPDLRNVAINVSFQLPGESPTEVPTIMAAERELVARFEAKYPDVKIYRTGGVHISNAFDEAAQKDATSIIPLMFVFILLVCFVMLRSFAGMLAVSVIILFSIASGFGFAGWIGISLTPPSIISSIIIMTLAVADSIHVMLTTTNNMRDGMEKKAALKESLRLNMMPVFVTSATTILGFLTINFADSPPLNHLGNMVAVGMAAAFFFSVTLLPAMLSLLPLSVKPHVVKQQTIMDKVADVSITYRHPLLIGLSVITLVLSVLATKNKGDDNFIQYFDETYQFRVHTDHIADELVSFYRMIIPMNSGVAEGVADPEYLKKLERFTYWLEQQPEVLHVNSVVSIFKKLNKNMNQGNAMFEKIPEDKELAAQYLLMYEMSLPYGLDLTDQISLDKSGSLVDVVIQPLGAVKTRALVERTKNWLYTTYPEFADPQRFASPTAPNIMFSYISGRNISQMVTGMLVALLLISLCLVFALRDIKIGLLSIIPNVAPIGLAFGLWYIVVGTVTFTMAVAMGMTLGIVVDDTVHFLSKYLRAKKEQQLSTEEAIRYTFRHVGNALFVMSVVLVVGFAILSTSHFQANSGMAQLTVLAIIAALITDFFMLPALLMLFDKDKHKS